MTSIWWRTRVVGSWLGAAVVLLAGCGGGGPQASATLASLTLSYGELDQPFQATVTEYTAAAPFLIASLRVVPVVTDAAATVTVGGVGVGSGEPSQAVTLAEGDTVIEVVVTAADGVTTKSYSVTVTREPVAQFAQQAYVKASNTDAYDNFGFSVALSGHTLVVGAFPEDSGATGVDGDQSDNDVINAGAVYVFVRDGTTWTQQAYLKASNPQSSDHFGYSVAISGDTLAVSAPREDSSATGVGGNQFDDNAADSGAVYVFVRDGGTWSQQAYVKASNTGAGDFFGWAVALSGDTLAVGAPMEDSNGGGVNGGAQADDSAVSSGAAYVFVRNGGSWSQEAYVKASNTRADTYFGWSIALSGDTLAVGSWGEDSNATGVNNGNQADVSAPGSGAAYVFVREGGTWGQQAYVKASNTDAGDSFGSRIALDADTLVVAATGEDGNGVGVDGDQSDNNAVSSGAAYVFHRSGGTWSQQAYVKASNTQEVDQFGIGVAVSGDVMAVTANLEDSNGVGVNSPSQADDSASASGAAYVYVRDGATWSQRAYVKASNSDTFDNFGFSVAVDGDTVVVGAHYERSGATGIDGNQDDDLVDEAGAVYVFR